MLNNSCHKTLGRPYGKCFDHQTSFKRQMSGKALLSIIAINNLT